MDWQTAFRQRSGFLVNGYVVTRTSHLTVEDRHPSYWIEFNNDFLRNLKTSILGIQKGRQYKRILAKFKEDIHDSCTIFDPYARRGAGGRQNVPGQQQNVSENYGKVSQNVVADARTVYT